MFSFYYFITDMLSDFRILLSLLSSTFWKLMYVYLKKALSEEKKLKVYINEFEKCAKYFIKNRNSIKNRAATNDNSSLSFYLLMIFSTNWFVVWNLKNPCSPKLLMLSSNVGFCTKNKRYSVYWHKGVKHKI